MAYFLENILGLMWVTNNQILVWHPLNKHVKLGFTINQPRGHIKKLDFLNKVVSIENAIIKNSKKLKNS